VSAGGTVVFEGTFIAIVQYVFMVAYTWCRHFIHVPSFNCFLSSSFAINSQNTALNCAATKGRLHVCKFLVESGADIKARSWYVTILHHHRLNTKPEPS